jgi:hypothetical protein
LSTQEQATATASASPAAQKARVIGAIVMTPERDVHGMGHPQFAAKARRDGGLAEDGTSR